MDLSLYGRTLWRFKFIVLAGVVAAAGLAFLAAYRVGPGGKLIPRQAERWASYSQIFVTQQGFPSGRIRVATSVDSSRFVALALLYAGFANSDPVKQLMRGMGTPIAGQIESTAVLSSTGGTDALPIISVAGIAATRSDSLELTARATKALVTFVRQQQAANGIPANNRVLVQEIASPGRSTLLSPRSTTVPIMVFLAVLTLVVGIAFALENLRPRIRSVERDERTVDRNDSQSVLSA